MNVQSLVANYNRVELLIYENMPDFFVCTEARFTEEIGESEICVNGYKIFRSSSSTRNSGGIVVYVKEGVKFRLIKQIKQNDNILIFFIDRSRCRGFWIAVYHSPNSNHMQFLDQLSYLYESYIPASANVYVSGDFNIDLKSTTLPRNLRDKLHAFENNNNLKQVVTKYTRVSQTSKTLIDHCYTNDRHISAKIVDDVSVADHKMIIIRKKDTTKNYLMKISF